MLFADAAKAAGITDYRRPEALNTHPLFIESLAQLVERHLGEAADGRADSAETGAVRTEGAR